jgi:predicted O-methyltransferase YrrM
MFKVTKESLEIVREISDKINNQTFHHHYHILYDIANSYDSSYKLNYLEIGCYAGGSACLMLQRPNTNVISIDLGYPIDKEVVVQNTNKMNKYNNKYNYIKGSSHNSDTIYKLESELNGILLDILFIDGDHSYAGVINDFNNYSKYVKEGGYIVFDDYNDIQYSPEVKKAVDSLEFNGYKILGTFGDEFGARPNGLKSNEFVIKKN